MPSIRGALAHAKSASVAVLWSHRRNAPRLGIIAHARRETLREGAGKSLARLLLQPAVGVRGDTTCALLSRDAMFDPRKELNDDRG
jgi:hypothetical protein